MTDTHAYRMIAHYMKATPLKAMIETLATTATTMLKCTQTTNIPNLPHIQDFIARIMAVSTCDSAVLVLPLVYMHRLRTTTKISAARGMKCTAHRVVLAAMGIAQKITTDVSYSNACWAAHSDIFTVLEYNLMERQLLELLEYRLVVGADEMLTVLQSIGGLVHAQMLVHPMYVQPPHGAIPLPYSGKLATENRNCLYSSSNLYAAPQLYPVPNYYSRITQLQTTQIAPPAAETQYRHQGKWGHNAHY